jgi:hypothetical protein
MHPCLSIGFFCSLQFASFNFMWAGHITLMQLLQGR